MFLCACACLIAVQFNSSSKQLGVELGDRPSAYIDLGPWTRRFQRADGSECKVDEAGWPAEDGTTVIMDDRAFPAWSPPIDDPAHDQPRESGTYTLEFSGKAVVSASNGSPVHVGTGTYSPATNSTTYPVELRPGEPDLIILNFSNTQRNPSASLHSGISDLHFYRPGYSPTTARQVFTHDFLKAIRPFRYLRFMGWLDTNYQAGFYGDAGHHALDWDSRNLPGELIDRPGTRPHALPWEYVILLANLVHKDVWINVPIAATGENPSETGSYVYNLARLLKEGNQFTAKRGIDPSLHIYIEHSNEVWNFGFSQYIWNKLAAIDEVNHGGSVLNKDGTTDQEQWARRRHAVRLLQIGRIFEKVFGPGSLNHQIRPVLAVWTIQPEPYRDVLTWMSSTFGAPASYFFGVAETAYFNDQKASKSANPNEVLAAMIADSDSGRGYTIAWRQIANQFALKLCAYESGPDNGGGDATNIANRILANRLPGMEQAVIHNYRDNFFGLGGDMASYFGLSSAYSRYGCWGATDDLSNLETPKYSAILKIVASLGAGRERQGSGGKPGLLAPTNVQAVAVGGLQVQISWAPVRDGASYTVWYTTGGNFLIAGQGLTVPRFVQKNLDPTATYTYYVTASSNGQAGPPSVQVQVKPVP